MSPDSARLRVLLVALLIVVTPIQASAEVAWVMWTHTTTAGVESGWQASEAYDNKLECEQAVRGYVERAASGPGKAQTVGSVVIYPSFNTIMLYRCLPDTVDPRGPKEK